MALTKAELKYLRSLQTKSGRRQNNRFLGEGIRLLEDALRAGYLPQTVLYAPSELSPRGEKLIKKFAARKVTTQAVTVRECRQLNDTKTPQGIVAMFDHKTYDLQQQLKRRPRRILICDKIGDPGNFFER